MNHINAIEDIDQFLMPAVPGFPRLTIHSPDDTHTFILTHAYAGCMFYGLDCKQIQTNQINVKINCGSVLYTSV